MPVCSRPGGLVVANGLELLWFDADGALVARNGGRGGGPSEFQSLVALDVLSGDSVIALNRVPPMAKVFAPSGEFAREYAVGQLPLRPSRHGAAGWAGLGFADENL
jgi:hypothetical protein